MFETWHRKLFTPKVKILGGEPLLNPELGQILCAARCFWPTCRIILHTNGLLLEKHLELFDILQTKEIHLAISWHSREPTYLESFDRILDIAEQRKIIFTVTPSINQWRRTTKGVGSSMRPWQSEPREAWQVCPAKYAVQLFENRLWKCPPLAYLRLVVTRFSLGESTDWAPFLAYKGLGPECTAEQLKMFLRREDESVCGMCSSEPTFIVKDIHKRTIR
jgi:hypothetical protein